MADETLKSLSGLIIGALVLFLIVLPSCTNFFGKTDDQAFFQAKNLLDELLDDQTIAKNFGQITLEDDSFLIGINPHVDSLVITRKDTNAYIRRPPSCPDDEACLCLCLETVDDLDDSDTGEIKCEENQYLCKSYQGLIFPDEISGKDFFGSVSKFTKAIVSYQQGFFLFKRYDDLTIPQPLTLWLYRYEGKLIPTINPYYSPFPSSSLEQ